MSTKYSDELRIAVKAFKKENEFSSEDISRNVDIKLPALNKWLNGGIKKISLDNAMAIAKFIGYKII